MNIQGAVKACRRRKDIFARPKDWKGSGEAVDLGNVCETGHVRKVKATSSKTFFTTEWDISPSELIAPWELIPITSLTLEK